VVAGGTRALGHAHAFEGFELELDVVAKCVVRSQVQIFDIEQAAQFLPDLPQQVFLVQSGAEGAADLV
jgi:hypothetical protein